MKLRKFYPSQILRRLNGRDASNLDAASRRALDIGLRRSRKTTLAITVCGGRIDVRSPEELGRMILGDLKTMTPLFMVGDGAYHKLVFGPAGSGMSFFDKEANKQLET